MIVNPPFSLIGGDIARITLTMMDGSVPTNLTAMHLIWQLAQLPSKGIILDKELGSGITVIDGAGGIAEIRLDPADTKDLPVGNYYYELKMIDPTLDPHEPYTVGSGYLTIVRHLINVYA